jgi:SAM-dependent methyltransferase
MAQHNADQVADWNGQSGERWVAHQAQLDARLGGVRPGCDRRHDTPALFRVADASSAELPEGAFDILFSRFGVMFFNDPTGAFAHVRRALQPGGRVAFVCWRGAAENDWVRLPMGAIKGIVPPTAPPDPEAPGPLSFRRPGAGGSHPDGGRLHRYRYSALRCFRPVWRGRDAGRGDRRRGEHDVRGRPAVARAR